MQDSESRNPGSATISEHAAVHPAPENDPAAETSSDQIEEPQSAELQAEHKQGLLDLPVDPMNQVLALIENQDLIQVSSNRTRIPRQKSMCAAKRVAVSYINRPIAPLLAMLSKFGMFIAGSCCACKQFRI